MAPVEDNDSGMESQEGSQSVDVDLEKESLEESIESKEPPAKKQPAIEAPEEEDEVS